MKAKYSELTEISQADSLSTLAEFILFKHSTQCPISLAAFNEFNKFLADDTAISCYYVDVIKDRPVSQHLEKILNVLHESPQFIYVKDGLVKFHTSHRNITAEKITQAIS